MDGLSPLSELIAGIRRTILARRITLGVFSAVALVVLLTSRISYLNPLFYAPLIWFLLTFPFEYLILRQRTARQVHRVHAGFFVVEIALITVLVHLMGGSEWIGNVFYLFTVIYANAYLPRAAGALITLLVVVGYSGLVLLEFAGVIPHRSLFELVGGAPYQSLSYTVTTILAGSVAVYAVVAFTVRAFTDIYAAKNRALAARERELAEMSQRFLFAQDEERRRIARGLHDELIQSLVAIKLHLAPARERIPAPSYDEIVEVIDRSIEQTRTLAYSLRPPLLDELGLLPSLRRFAEMMARESGVPISVDGEIDGRLSLSLESLLFFVAQQGVQNAVKHAAAEEIRISVHSSGLGLVRLSVEDDGIGIGAGDAPGHGLRGIRERVDVAGGRTTVSPRPGGGTILSVEVPADAGEDRDRR